MGKKKYLIYNGIEKGNFIVRNEFQKILSRLELIEDIYGDEKIVVEELDDANKTIQKIIVDITKNNKIKALWRVNLEKEIEGISTKNYFRTPEIALLVLLSNNDSTYTLHILFIELKKSLQDKKLRKNSNPSKPSKLTKSTIDTCHEKFTIAMNRLYLLLTLNEHKNDDFYKNKTIDLQFKGFIFYNNDEIKEKQNTQLYAIFKGISNNNIIDCKTIFGDNDKMRVAFYKNIDAVSLDELLTI